MELVTSSMILSQFNVEPYTFFANPLENKFGRAELLKIESKLRPLLEQLRTRLFTRQVESHVRGIYRILKINRRSRAYLSAELFRSFSGGRRFSIVQDMPYAMEIIGKYFLYEFENNSGISCWNRSQRGMVYLLINVMFLYRSKKDVYKNRHSSNLLTGRNSRRSKFPQVVNLFCCNL